MEKKKQKLDTDSLGNLIKQGMDEKNMSFLTLYEKINDSQTTKRDLKNWINGYDFPNLDQIYKLAGILDLNPNEMLQIRNQINDENVRKPNLVFRRLFGRGLKYARPGFSVLANLMIIIAGLCLLYLIKGTHDTYGHLEDEVPGTVDNLIYEAQEEYTEN